MYDFSGQVVMVTGAGGNLGQAVMKAFHAAGAKLAAVDYRTGNMVTLFPELVNTSHDYLAEGVDVTDPEAVETVVQEIQERCGRIDVLVNTVGGYRAGTPVHETPLETWEYMLNLNARSVFIASKGVIPQMLGQGHGKIVNIASSAALEGAAKGAAYAASKSAVARLTESMSAEYKRKGINVNALIPGTIDSPQNREAMPNADYSLWVTPEELARVILFLASEDACAIHGALIPAYGKR